MKEIVVRALSGAVYVALVLGAAWAGPWVTALLFLPITLISAWEWHRLRWGGSEPSSSSFMSVLIAGLTYAACTLIVFRIEPRFAPLEARTAIALSLSMVLILIVLLFRSAVLRTGRALRLHANEPLQHLATIALGIAVPMACAVWLVAVDASFFIGFMLLLWTNDTGAYLVGKSIGRNKLLPKVSPGKTWEGLIGGIALTALVAWFWAVQSPALTQASWLIAAVVVSITATAGDLFESALKRAAGVKDSGTIMPGHGGALDRFDGYLQAAPAMLAVWALVGN
jgi:phosphatidate cytidylyltransferase